MLSLLRPVFSKPIGLIFFILSLTDDLKQAQGLFKHMPNQPETIPQITRQAKLNHILKSTQLDCLVLNPGPSLIYLTGLHFHLSERPVLVIFIPDAVPIIVLPELEQEKLKHLPFDIQAFPYGEDPSQWGRVFKNAAQAARFG